MLIKNSFFLNEGRKQVLGFLSMVVPLYLILSISNYFFIRYESSNYLAYFLLGLSWLLGAVVLLYISVAELLYDFLSRRPSAWSRFLEARASQAGLFSAWKDFFCFLCKHKKVYVLEFLFAVLLVFSMFATIIFFVLAGTTSTVTLLAKI